jgi:hypothetical protein
MDSHHPIPPVLLTRLSMDQPTIHQNRVAMGNIEGSLSVLPRLVILVDSARPNATKEDLFASIARVTD